MLTQEQISVLTAPFPEEALRADTSRGFELTSIKAAYVIERLNEAFGPCGIGWRYVHSPFQELTTDNGWVEIVTEVALQYCFRATNDCAGSDKVLWDAQTKDWSFRKGASNHDCSEPILACGGSGPGRGGAPYTDARKSAVTDGLTKAASMIGIGHRVFKGLVRVGSQDPSGNGRGRRPKVNNGPNATSFWTLYNEHAKPAGVQMTKAKALAELGDWAEACDQLRAGSRACAERAPINPGACPAWAGSARRSPDCSRRCHP
jgi:hypothetical protein